MKLKTAKLNLHDLRGYRWNTPSRNRILAQQILIELLGAVVFVVLIVVISALILLGGA